MGSATQETSLGRLVVGLIGMRAELRADGADEAAIAAASERSIRAIWPRVREWKYLCTICDDYGLELALCQGDRTCGREKPHLPHEFGRPCWCQAGVKFRKAPTPDPDADFHQAGKTPKKLSRFGR